MFLCYFTGLSTVNIFLHMQVSSNKRITEYSLSERQKLASETVFVSSVNVELLSCYVGKCKLINCLIIAVNVCAM